MYTNTQAAQLCRRQAGPGPVVTLMVKPWVEAASLFEDAARQERSGSQSMATHFRLRAVHRLEIAGHCVEELLPPPSAGTGNTTGRVRPYVRMVDAPPEGDAQGWSRTCTARASALSVMAESASAEDPVGVGALYGAAALQIRAARAWKARNPSAAVQFAEGSERLLESAFIRVPWKSEVSSW